MSVLRLQKTQVRISARPEARWTRLSSIVKSSGFNLQITEGGVSPENLKELKLKITVTAGKERRNGRT